MGTVTNSAERGQTPTGFADRRIARAHTLIARALARLPISVRVALRVLPIRDIADCSIRSHTMRHSHAPEASR